MKGRWPLFALLGLFLILFASGCASAPDSSGIPTPKVSVEVGQSKGQQETAVGLQIVFLLTILTIAPAILIMVTAFTRVIVVLGFVRNALGAPQLPPNQVLLGLSLFLTFFIMAPTFSDVNAQAIQPYMEGKISQSEAFDRGQKPVRSFMLKQTREKDLALFVEMAKLERPRTPDDVPTHVVIPAFVISELKTAFQMGFFIFIPFLVIDMVISSSLMSMGMMMLPPSLISLPFKVLLFVMADGWNLIVRSIVTSFV